MQEYLIINHFVTNDTNQEFDAEIIKETLYDYTLFTLSPIQGKLSTTPVKSTIHLNKKSCEFVGLEVMTPERFSKLRQALVNNKTTTKRKSK